MRETSDHISVPKKDTPNVSGGNEQGFSFYETKGEVRKTQEDALVCLNDLEGTIHLSPEEIGHRMWSTYQQLDASFTGRSGTTAASNYYDGKGNIITATLADAASFAAIYSKDGKVLKVVRLNSITHKPSDPSEKDRVTALGGQIVNNRVNGIIAVSRAIGDKNTQLEGFSIHPVKGKKIINLNEFKLADLTKSAERKPNGKPLIISEAKIDITSIDSLTQGINKEDISRIEVIVTCDGFTDGAGTYNQEKTDHEAYLMQCLEETQGLQGKELCEFLATKAIADGSTDNVSIASQTIYSENTPRNEPVFLGVYDGHGGDEASIHVAQNIGTVFRQQCALTQEKYIQNEYSVYKNPTQFTRDHPEQDGNKLYKEKMEFILTKIGFDSLIDKLITQKTNFQNKGQIDEVKAMDTLIHQLNSAEDNWKKDPKKENEFVSACKSTLEDAQKSPLKDYKESYWLINKIVMAINWLASFIKDEPLIKTEAINKIVQFKDAMKHKHEEIKENKEDSGKFTP
ncbi:MAG: hypothetical protein PSV35_03195 [bacterium]|nr:hypothetical protein [bacterium]